MRSSYVSEGLSEKLYVPIRSVQPLRKSMKPLHVPIRSACVPHTFLPHLRRIYRKVMRSRTFCETLPSNCDSNVLNPCVPIRSMRTLRRSVMLILPSMGAAFGSHAAVGSLPTSGRAAPGIHFASCILFAISPLRRHVAISFTFLYVPYTFLCVPGGLLIFRRPSYMLLLLFGVLATSWKHSYTFHETLLLNRVNSVLNLYVRIRSVQPSCKIVTIKF